MDGTWACELLGKSRIEGERVLVHYHESPDDGSLIRVLGQSRIAHRLYELAGIENVEELAATS